MQDFPSKLYPNLAKLDSKVAELLGSDEAKGWDVAQKEYEICKIHPIYWMEEYGFIRAGQIEGGTDEVGIIPFTLNTVQLQIADKICAHLINVPWTRIQVLILKHRKAGISTLIAAFDYWFMRFVRNCNAFLIADLGSHTDNIAAMVELFHQRDACGSELTGEMHCPKKVPMAKNKKGLKLSNGSMVELDSGENPNPGTSGTIQICHMSESSKWRGGGLTQETSLLNSIPRKGFAFIAKESTAFGLNKFAQDCEAAEKGLSNWEFIFISWKDLPDCEYEVLSHETIEPDIDEEELITAYKLSLGHIKFRRSQIELLGSEQQFKQDFPLNSREPFLITGSNYFNIELVQDRINEIMFFRDWRGSGWEYVKSHYPDRIPKLEGHPRGLKEALNILEMNNASPSVVSLTSNKNRISFVAVEKAKPEEGAMTMFYPPVRDRRYVVTVDVAEGKQTSEYTSDNSVVEVFDASRREQVAEWGGVFDEEMTAVYAVMIAKLYNKATVVPEMNNRCGGLLQANLEKLGYRNIYHRQKISSQTVNREFGWLTTRGNKQNVCGRFKQDFKNRDCLIHSIPLLEEMLFFIDTKGTLGASSGHTDDRVMAASVGLKVIEITPEYHQPMRKSSTAFSDAHLQVYPEYQGGFVNQKKTKKLEALRRYGYG